MSKVLTGFEGIVTPAVLAARRQKDRRAALKSAGTLQSGLDFGARTVGLALGGLIKRALPPGEEDRRAVLAEQIIKDSTQLAEEQVFEGDLAGYDRRISAVNTAIKGLVAEGLTERADVLRSNATALKNQRFEQKVNLAKLAGTEASTEATLQATEFNQLGDAATVLVPGISDPITVAQMPDSSIEFTDPNTGVERVVEKGNYMEVALQGGIDEVAPDRKHIRTQVAKLNAQNALMNLGLLMRKSIVEDPRSPTFATNVGAALNSVALNARALVTAKFGAKADLLNRGDIERVLGEMGITHGIASARGSQLAYAIATSREGGRLTTQDITQAMIAAGLTSTDPAVRIAALDDLMLNTENEFLFMGKDPVIAGLPQYTAMEEVFVGLHNARAEFSVAIPGRDEGFGEALGLDSAKDPEGDEKKRTDNFKPANAIFEDERGSIF